MNRYAANIMTTAAVTCVGALVSLGALAPVHAEGQDGGDPLAAIGAVTDRASTASEAVLARVASVPTRESGRHAIDTAVNGVAIAVPTDSASPVTIGAAGSEATSISLPRAGGSAPAEALGAGVVSFDHRDGSSTTVVTKSDGAVQVVSVLDGRSAPTRLSFGLHAGAASTVALRPDGSATVQDAHGVEVASVAAPWAKDADGNDVATHYEVRGDQLVQVIDHRAAGVVYPVVADPAITASSYRYVATNVTVKKNQPNYNKRVGSCKVGTTGATCTITGGYRATATVNAALGLSAHGVAATLGISASAEVNGSIACHSPALRKGQSWNAYIKGTFRYFTLKKYKVTKAGGITAKKLVSTAKGQVAFTPSYGIYCVAG